jgi:opacity protein-like surface antigen
MKVNYVAAAVIAAIFLPGAAHAQQWYAGGSIGAVMQSDSDNSGRTGAFTTGNGSPTVPNGTAVAAGTNYGWTTEFDGGVGGSIEAGLRDDNGLRYGLELAYSQADVDRHSGVTLGGTALDGVDAAVLTGSATQLGVTVGQVVSDGRGDITNLGLFANAYYDFNREGALQPYLGAGVGVSQVEVDYSPSGIQIIDGDDTVFAWQLKAGATWRLSDTWEAYGEYVYRQSDDITFDNQLFPGTLDIENKQSLLLAGVRFRFG